MNCKKTLSCAAICTAALAACAYLNPSHHYISALLLIVCAFGSYFYMAMACCGRNWFDIRPVFSAVWLLTIGLAALRLTDYQQQWLPKTWYCVALAYGMFFVGAELGAVLGKKVFAWLKGLSGKKLGKLVFALREERLFWICLTVSVLGLCCFVANVLIKGYVPFFASANNSYATFYTKFYLFAVAACMISGLCYYTLKTQKLAAWQRIAMYLCIIYSTFVFPTLIVSRGTLVTSALSLTTAVFYLNKRRLPVLAACVAVIVVFYGIGSMARGYSDAQLDAFFEPSKVTVSKPGSSKPNTGNESNGTTIKLPSKVAFVYTYLTVSHDNFNEAVENTERFTCGARQLTPFNVILRIPAINDAAAGEYYTVRPHLTTVSLIGNAYYDFGLWGVGVMMLLWAILFGAIQQCFFVGNGPFAMLTLGNTMTPVALCFFDPWMSNFSHWMHWGLILILWLIASISVERKQ